MFALDRIGLGHGVGDPGTVRGELGIGHLAQPEQIGDRHRPGDRGVGGRGGSLRAETVREARAAGKRTVDLSSDFRLSPEAVYGLTEVTRPRLLGAELVANPGCYPTAALLALLPLAQQGLIDQSREVVIDAASGVTGAGRTPKRELLFGEVAE